ncbi:flavin-dependent oxidoreductase [Rhodococcus qingshengii]|uniref:flavin-dependent oxidoreductase n=1 Tax=Rhodococcus qingshengii TaxID=334542 RepID=UPI0036DC6F45
MRVIVAGAGIGGLVTALSLHEAGFKQVQVVESVSRLRPLGVGINLLPHAVRELDELGLAEPLARLGVPTAELAYFNNHGQLIWSEPRGRQVGYRWPQYSVHRGQLQMLLLKAVRERLGPGAVRTGEAVRGFTAIGGSDTAGSRATEVEVLLTSGVEYADLLVGADGIRSTVRAQLYPDEPAPLWNGLVLWRGTTRMPPFRGGRSMIMAGDDTQKFVAYPISTPDAAGEVEVNWVAERSTSHPDIGRGDWNRQVEAAEFIDHFADWTFGWLDVPEIVRGASAIYVYPMVDRDPLLTWTHGPVTLLGDAAHPMYPIGSNGASQAVLDARVLADALARHNGDLGAACLDYEALRREATSAIVLANREMGPELVISLAHKRAPHGFLDIDRVIPLEERAEIAARYKRLAGFDPALLNDRRSYDSVLTF